MPIQESPQLSIVVASRNDTHGGDILKRMRLFLACLIEQSRRHRFLVELVFVEWNPAPGRPSLRDLLPRPSEADYLRVRYITVPASIHFQYRRASEIPLFQMIAKNVGIRRAAGTFVLCTNIDLLFSDALFRKLAAAKFRADTFYRANRCDVPDGIDPAWSLAEQLAWCQRNIIRRLGRDMRYKNVNLELIGFGDSSAARKWLLDKMAMGMSLFWSREKHLFYQLDSFACGDFTLMSRDAWIAIQGYLELDLYSLHVDSLALVAAAALGYRQEVFPPEACTYHIDHPSGWGALGPLEKIRFLESRPALDFSLVQEVGLFALQKREVLDLNPPNWGYSDVELEEFAYPEVGRTFAVGD